MAPSSYFDFYAIDPARAQREGSSETDALPVFSGQARYSANTDPRRVAHASNGTYLYDIEADTYRKVSDQLFWAYPAPAISGNQTRFSPDGKYVFFEDVERAAEGTHDVDGYLFNLERGTITQIDDAAIQFSGFASRNITPWSNNSRYLAFYDHHDARAENTRTIYLYDTQTDTRQGPIQTEGGVRFETFEWQPNTDTLMVSGPARPSFYDPKTQILPPGPPH